MARHRREEQADEVETTAVAEELPRHDRATRIEDAVKGRRAARSVIEAREGEQRDA